VHGVAPVVAEIDRSKWDAALTAGAAQVIDPRDPEAVKALVGRTGGAAAVVDFVGAPSTVGFAMQVLRRGGRLVIVGLMGGAIELQLPLLPIRALSIIGSFVGSLDEMRALLALAREGKVAEIPVQVRALEEAQRTLGGSEAGQGGGAGGVAPLRCE